MTFVVTEACVNCKHTTCVSVCPTDAFREGENFLVIDPEACIDCDLCPPECPVDAIYAEDEVPDDQFEFIALNAELALVWSEISSEKPPMVEHEAWAAVEDKRHLLVR